MKFTHTAFQELAQRTSLTHKRNRVFGDYRGREVHIRKVSYGCFLWLLAIIAAFFSGGEVDWANKMELLVTLKKPTKGGFRLRRALSMRFRKAVDSEIAFERQFRIKSKPSGFSDQLLGDDLKKRLQRLDTGIFTYPAIQVRLNRRQLLYQRQVFQPPGEDYTDHLLGVLDLLSDIAEAAEKV